MGVQSCLSDGTFGVCTCGPVHGGAADAASVEDAAVVVDAATIVDAGPSDTGAFDAGPTDSGVPVHGHAVVMGYDGTAANDSVDALITNAVFVSERSTTSPLRILEYTQYSSPGLETHYHSVLDGAASTRHRTITYTELASDSVPALSTSLASADVFLVRPQNIGSGGAFGTLGDVWHDTIVAFLDAGGVVVIMMNQNQGSESTHDEWKIASGTGLFMDASSPYWDSYNVPSEIVAPTDPIAAGVLSPYASNTLCLDMMSGGTLVARTSSPGFCTVVRHITR